jgi:hypothetical protein
MKAIRLHDRNTEAIVGTIYTQSEVHSVKFFNEVYRTWKDFNNEMYEDDFDIHDFVEYHNRHSDIEIDSLECDFIQL